jgi:hypothetical protein
MMLNAAFAAVVLFYCEIVISIIFSSVDQLSRTEYDFIVIGGAKFLLIIRLVAYCNFRRNCRRSYGKSFN